MKERYFTTQSLNQQALDLFQSEAEISRNRQLKFQPSKSALLVLDMQAYFLDPASHAYIPSAEAILGGIIQLIIEYNRHNWPIIFTQHTNTQQDAGMMSRWWRDIVTDQNPLHHIVSQIDTSLGDVIQKSQYDAFYQTPLEENLHERGVTQVVICGVMTHLCCETTARSAFMRGYEVFFPVDGTATYNLTYHQASLLNLAHGFASVVLMKDILKAIRGEHES